MTARRVLRWVLLTAATVLFLYPFVWLLSASLKPGGQVFDNALLPHTWAWGNYADIWRAAPVAAWLLNSVAVSLAAAVTVTLTSSLVAFGFAYFRFPGRNALFGLVLATMMLPGAVTMIPVYLIWNSAGLAHTQVPLWAGNLFGSAFYIFLLRQFFLGLPREVFEAARVDGASHWTLFWRIAVPLCRPALIVSFVFELKASWSDLLKPLIYLRDPALYTLPRGLKALSDQFGQAGEQRWEIVLAGSVLTTVPLLIVFFLAQRYFLAGITTDNRRG
ncbi:multiple sugar transport system permease protein [Amycolatopsis pretoriensis]|uniref:Multiple sugar transport system permease protein n=1 Tax=Amycolatopsis pretoriensis TaxID=218821 RepID=A0A1H5Q0H7_9PSEU|nr:carbohydrate ABC transporter permease [Amycolatopsis pretoriensis]SEF19546.1 multiple sugar transport system permease protein [Amycolatopsis pretoriensis]